MTPPDLSRLAPRYGLGPWEDLTPLRPGTVSRVWRLTAGGRPYVLRTLPSREQGEAQYRLHRHLALCDAFRVPAILPTAAGEPCVLADGTWYHLQALCPGHRPDPAHPGEAARAFSAALALSAALRDFPHPLPPDRFDLAAAWETSRPFWDPALGLSLAQADAQVAALSAPSAPLGAVHGDLGPWNLLLDGDTVSVIDFGEAHMAHPLFDLASLLGGLLNHAPAPLRPRVLDEFSAAGAVESAALLTQLRLWAWRGVALWLPRGRYVPQLLATLRFAESHPFFTPS